MPNICWLPGYCCSLFQQLLEKGEKGQGIRYNLC